MLEEEGSCLKFSVLWKDLGHKGGGAFRRLQWKVGRGAAELIADTRGGRGDTGRTV